MFAIINKKCYNIIVRTYMFASKNITVSIITRLVSRYGVNSSENPEIIGISQIYRFLMIRPGNDKRVT